MNPKEKALNLYNKINLEDEGMHPYHSIRCALITVDEIMIHPAQLMYDIVWYEFRTTDMNNFLDIEPMHAVRMNALEYWNEVKNEIKKL